MILKSLEVEKASNNVGSLLRLQNGCSGYVMKCAQNHKHQRRNVDRLLSMLVFFSLTFLGSPGFADREAPFHDFVQPTASGTYVFVMLVTPEFQEASLTPQDREIRKRYPCSGLFRKDNLKNPLWTVDWYAPIVYPSSDGKHLARLTTWPPKDEYNSPVIQFYRSGNKLREFTVRELVTDIDILPRSVSHYSWLRHAEWDEQYGLFIVETLSGEKRVFNPQRMKGPEIEQQKLACTPNPLYK